MSELSDQSQSTPQKKPGELALERAEYVRKQWLNWMVGSWNKFAEHVEKEGFSADEGYALVGEAMARVDMQLPQFVCPLCVLVDVPEKRCLCRGRGYFLKNESIEFARAQARATRAARGDQRSIYRVIRSLAKGVA